MKQIILLSLFMSVTLFATKVDIKVFPINAKIFINGVYQKTTSEGLSVDLKEGHYNILVTKSNYLSQEVKFWLTDKSQAFEIKLIPHSINFQINSNTPNSTLKVNNQVIENKRAPFIFYNEGTIIIEESLKGHKSIKKEIKVKLGNSYLVDLPKLEEFKTNLTVSGNLPNTSIRLDGKEIGKGSLLGYNSAKRGSHQLTLINPGYKTYDTSILLFEQPVKIDYNLEKIKPKYFLGVGASYNYSFLKVGGYPEFNLALFMDKTKIKLDLFYIVSPSNDLEYQGFAIGGQYQLYKQDIFSFYLGGDLLFSNLLEDNKKYDQYAIGLNAVFSLQIIKDLPLYVDLDITNRIHYLEDDVYNIAAKLSLTYLF